MPRENAVPANSHEEVPDNVRGSPEHLVGLLSSLEFLLDNYSTSHRPDTTEMQEMFDHVFKQCHDLLDDPDAIKDTAIRTEFFEGLHEVTAAVKDMINKRREFRTAASITPDRVARILEKSNGYKLDLPRWSQFFGLNAPGAMAKLDVVRNPNNVELNRGYQIVPPAGIGILRHWDNQLRLIISEIDPSLVGGTLRGRFEWGIQGDFVTNVTSHDEFCEEEEDGEEDEDDEGDEGDKEDEEDEEGRRANPQPVPSVPSYDVGQNLRNNMLTFDGAIELGHHAHILGPQESFNFLLVQHQIEWDDLECAREAHPLTDEQHKKWEAEERVREKVYEEGSRPK
uniref:MAT1-1-4 n=1 Tax=Eutiarosporella tritici-australis TaxID=1686411 RepID=A0A2D1GT36_9PEZI|nr:MAT1-1-4 [Eutiarosporella tritici-australis]